LKTVAYQGEPGAYSEQASLKFFGEKIQLSPSMTFEDVFEKVKKKKVDFGVVPVENSLYGIVFETYDLLLKYSLKIIGELNLGINHYLMANKKYQLKDIKKVFSHPQALGQCSSFLQTLKKVEVNPIYDTAGAAKLVAENPTEPFAAIASKSAAENYNLKIIKTGIQNNNENYTRFLIISNKGSEINLDKKTKTSICFELKSIPGSLFRALSVFALRDINLTKIESRPIQAKPFQYIFYIDLIGNLKDKKIKNALNHLKEISDNIKIFGSYEIGQTYKT